MNANYSKAQDENEKIGYMAKIHETSEQFAARCIMSTNGCGPRDFS